jgi:hypothetical protein
VKAQHCTVTQVEGKRATRNVLAVIFDGCVTPITLHRSYLEPADEAGRASNLQSDCNASEES